MSYQDDVVDAIEAFIAAAEDLYGKPFVDLDDSTIDDLNGFTETQRLGQSKWPTN